MFLNFKKFPCIKCVFSILDYWPDCKTKKNNRRRVLLVFSNRLTATEKNTRLVLLIISNKTFEPITLKISHSNTMLYSYKLVDCRVLFVNEER